jgi:lipopolysaccharide biosynthesis regulator YciM
VLELLWLLLPVAAGSGWWAASRSARRSVADRRGSLSPEYFRGLNFLLNEQPDEAIEAFVGMLDANSETVETHLALGSLFRRRGEVERAIRVHQNIFTRPDLSREQRVQGLLELGRDYRQAGLLDRAEGLFLELAGLDAHAEEALRLLVDIYQQERDWHKAISAMGDLERLTGGSRHAVIAQYYCELAESARRRGDRGQALEQIGEALSKDRDCARASLIEARLRLQDDDLEGAIRAYKRLERQAPEFLPELVKPLMERYRRRGRDPRVAELLEALARRQPFCSLILARAELLCEAGGPQAGIEFLTRCLRERPSLRGVYKLMELALPVSEGEARDRCEVVYRLTGRLLETRAVYACGHCGFTGRALHWQCPSCKRWNAVRPIQGVEGE